MTVDCKVSVQSFPLASPLTSVGCEASTMQDVRPSLPLCDSGQQRRYHIDLVSLDGPRALFTCFDCVDQHNGTLCATAPRCSLWTTLAPPRTDV